VTWLDKDQANKEACLAALIPAQDPPKHFFGRAGIFAKCLILLVVAPRFELVAPSLPDGFCAQQWPDARKCRFY
jgi:hypothetical protein